MSKQVMSRYYEMTTKAMTIKMVDSNLWHVKLEKIDLIKFSKVSLFLSKMHNSSLCNTLIETIKTNNSYEYLKKIMDINGHQLHKTINRIVGSPPQIKHLLYSKYWHGVWQYINIKHDDLIKVKASMNSHSSQVLMFSHF